MRTHVHQSAPLGELVVAAFDAAAHYSTDPLEVSRLATQAVGRMLRGAQRRKILMPRPTMRAKRAPSVDGGQAEVVTMEKNVGEIRDAACGLLLSKRRASHGVTEGDCQDQYECPQELW
jgi:hypothetical protein